MKLTDAQKEVVKSLESGYYVWTNEGSNFKAWIGDENGEKKKGIRLKTAENLLNKGVIKFIDGEYRAGLFKYTLAKS